MEGGPLHTTEHDKVYWTSCRNHSWFHEDDTINTWIVEGPQYTECDIKEHGCFCDAHMLCKIMDTKTVLSNFDAKRLREARANANPYESIGSAFFMNRAALKMANIDAATGFMFTEFNSRYEVDDGISTRYFADVCAGPGGFSEYILWRKGWRFKGFGFTLRGHNEFQLINSRHASWATFSHHFGPRNDGNIYYPVNIEDFSMRVKHETSKNLGVHFMMSDGGFSVQGNENLQEVLSKRMYACQCLMALEILRPGGHFVTKMFDMYTTFTAGLIFLMYNCFDKIAVFKPITSRPANSERYLLCFGLQECVRVTRIRAHLSNVVRRFCELDQSAEKLHPFAKITDVNEIVPLSTVVERDHDFVAYLRNTNDRLGIKQLLGLNCLIQFYNNDDDGGSSSDTITRMDWERLRLDCLISWNLPEQPARDNFDNAFLVKLLAEKNFLLSSLYELSSTQDFESILSNIKSWNYAPMSCKKRTVNVNLYAATKNATTTATYRYQHRDGWTIVKKLPLVPGTVLYGELVQENVKDGEKEHYRRVLHVIDAWRLGNFVVGDLPFKIRQRHVRTYCDAVNHELRSAKTMRVRAKPTAPLQDLCYPFTIYDKGDDDKEEMRKDRKRCEEGFDDDDDAASFYHTWPLPNLMWQSRGENFHMTSILLYKSENDVSFDESFKSRTLVHLTTTMTAKTAVQNGNEDITLSALIEQVRKFREGCV